MFERVAEFINTFKVTFVTDDSTTWGGLEQIATTTPRNATTGEGKRQRMARRK